MRSAHAHHLQFAPPSNTQDEGATGKAVADISESSGSFCECLQDTPNSRQYCSRRHAHLLTH